MFVAGAKLNVHTRLDAAQEQALVDQCRRNDFDAFSRIVDAYQGRVLGFVKGMVHNTEEALDVTQEVFIKAYQAFHRFDSRCSLRTWLFKIAYNLCIDRSRKIDRRPIEMSFDLPADGSEPIEHADSTWNPESIVISDELVQCVQSGLETMSEKLRTVLTLHDQEELSYDEIAATLSIPVGTVKSRLFLARVHLQNHLKSYLQGGHHA